MEENQKDITTQNQKDTIKVSLFNNKKGLAYIHQKGQKLATAIYLISDLFKDSEVLKWRMREKVLALVSSNLDLVLSDTVDKKNYLNKVSRECVELLTQIEIAKASSLISEMNFSILKSEFLDLLHLLETREDFAKADSSLILTESFFGADRQLLESSMGQIHKGHESVFNNMSFNLPSTKVPFTDLKQEKSQGHTQATQLSNYKHVGNARHPQVKENVVKDKKNNRQEIILDIIKKRREVTIKDLVAVIDGCSEKTVQRELTSMLEKGVLKRVGERRWSKYSLRHN